jgi:hypothetical protein
MTQLATQPLRRLPDWPERLAGYLSAMRPHRFAWGTHDCVRFAAGAVHAVTGQQPTALQWDSPAAAARLLRRVGTLAQAVGQVLPELPAPTLAQRGDVVLVQMPVHGGRAQRQWLAVADGPQWWVPSVTGLASGPMDLAHRAWGVGHG